MAELLAKKHWVGLCVFMMGSISFSEPSYLPRLDHYEAAEKGKSCSAYRVVMARSQHEVTQQKSILERSLETVKAAYLELERCGQDRGMILSPNQRGKEAVLAELCPQAYEAWLKPSYHVLMIQEQIQAAQKTAKEIQRHLQSRCALLPAKFLEKNIF